MRHGKSARHFLVAASRIADSDPKCTHTLMSEPPSVSGFQRGMSSTVSGPDTAAPGGGFGTPRATDNFTPIARR